MNNDQLRFDGKCVIVTGAGRGLGRAHALAFAARGASVVVNDLGGEMDGTGAGPAAEAVVAEIARAGGAAVADGHDVASEEGPAAIVERARAAFGPVYALVNNAGIARPAGFGRLDPVDVHEELRVHVVGSMALMAAAWNDLRSCEGRVVNTASGVGAFGLAGAGGYAAAKAAIIGVTRTAALEGARSGVAVNAVAPFARTRMAGAFGDLLPHLDPELVSSVVLWMAHESCQARGEIFSAGGGRVARMIVATTEGVSVAGLRPEDVADAASSLLAADQLPIEMADALAEAELIRAGISSR